MKRDMDLVREILHSIEERGDDEMGVEIPGRSKDELRLHLRLMEDAGLVEGVSFTTSSALCERLSWQGYDFLEAARKDTIWQKAKDFTVQQTGGLSLAALTESLKVVVKMAITGTP